MANSYTSSTDAFADISEGNYSSTDTVLNAVMVGFVTAASRLIDKEMGRWDGFFYPTTDSSTDYYDGSGLEAQEIDEYASISSVAVAEQGGVSSTNYTAWTENTDYLTWPYNRRGKPITKLVLDVIDGQKGGFYRYQKAVKVVGIPGYSLTPPDIVALACKMQAIRWFMRAKQGYQDAGANVEIGSMTFKGKLELDPDIKALLWLLKLELER